MLQTILPEARSKRIDPEQANKGVERPQMGVGEDRGISKAEARHQACDPPLPPTRFEHDQTNQNRKRQRGASRAAWR